MVALYVISSERAVGKTAICASIGNHLMRDGKKVGFFKPITHDEGTDSDAVFMKHVFSLDESVDCLCPVIGNQDKLVNSIKEAYVKVSPGKDVVIIEGISEQSQAYYQIAKALDARVIIVEDYSKDLPTAKSSYKDFGEYLLGVVLNKVPISRLDYVHNELSSQFGEAGVNILGVFPEDRALFSLTVGELAEYIQGEILNSTEKSIEIVENLMLGAMCVDPGPQYFSRKANKAVVVRGERPDMQLAALETSIRCLVLSGDAAPIPAVLYRAEDKSIPIILTRGDTIATVTSIEDALGKTRFNQEKKLPKLTEIMEQHFNFQALYQGLGLAD
ncbi:MAG TPA: phosphotransacetylase family protein [Dehalococcoidia bacterium]|nr:phosphotransacetylase family protein [Dehalococcoidia bacterium]